MTENVDLHVAGYHLTELIGSGGMGEVYKAVVANEGKSLPVGTVVAIKLLHTHLQRISEFQKRFHREANLAAKIDHPNVVRVIEAGIDYRYHYIVMEYVEGLKLTDLMQDKQPLSPQQTIEVMSQICEALHAASHIVDDYSLDAETDADDLPAVSNIPVRIRSLVHRDIKPDNILIQPRDPREYEQMSQTGDKKALANIHVKLLDFGLAKDVKAISTILSMAGQSLGTPAYMSPEQCQGDIVDQRTDIYSLGICAYQMITGTTPFPGPTTVAYAKQHAEEIPPDILTRNPLCPKNLADCIMRCLAKNAKDRYQTPETLKEDLQRVAQGKSVCKIHKFKKPRSISKRKISAIVLTTIVVVLLAMGGLWYYMTDRAKSSLQESIRQADLAVAAEKYTEAEEILNQAISDFPNRPDKEQLTAMAQLRLRDVSAQAAKQRNTLAQAKAEEKERQRKAAEEQVKRQHEQTAEKAITEIQAQIAQGEYQKAIDAANNALKEYADTDNGKRIPELLAEATTKLKGKQEAERAKEEAEKKRLEAEKIARHDRFVEYRDQGRAAMQKRDYHAAKIAFENALKEEDDEDTRKQYDLAVDRTTRHRIAVVDFSEKGDVGIQDAGRVVAELLVSKFSLDRYELIERSQLARLLEEVDLSISLVRDNPEKAYENLKKLKSVRFLIIGSVVKLGDLTATARMVDVQTGVIRQTAEVSAKDAQTLKDALKELANILQMTPEEKRDYLDESVYPKLINDAREKAKNKEFDEAITLYRRVLAIRSSPEVQQELSLVESNKAFWIKQQEAEKEKENKYSIIWQGIVTGTIVYIRSGPNMESYPVAKISSPDRVQVVKQLPGGEWLAIRPMKGCYGVIAAKYIHTDATGKLGTVNEDNVLVRAAGELRTKDFNNPIGKLNKGDPVRVVGRVLDDNNNVAWYVIKPPINLLFYILSKDVERFNHATASIAQSVPADNESITVNTPVNEELEALKQIRRLEKELVAESAKPIRQRNYDNLLQRTKAISLPENSRFLPIYNSLLSYVNEEFNLVTKLNSTNKTVDEVLIDRQIAPELYDAIMAHLNRGAPPSILPDVVRIWAKDNSTTGPSEECFRTAVELDSNKSWDETLLGELNSKTFDAKGEALQILLARMGLQILKTKLLAMHPETEELLAIQTFAEKFDYLPTSREQLVTTTLIYRARQNMLPDAAAFSLNWSTNFGYSFNISDFHLLSRLARDPIQYNISRETIIKEVSRAIHSRKIVKLNTTINMMDDSTDFWLRHRELTIPDLWNLYLLNEMLSRPRVQTKLRLMAGGDLADTKSAWGGLVYYQNGQAEANLYPPDKEASPNDMIYQPSKRVILDGRDALCRFIAHFEKIENASRAGPTAEELADAKEFNYYGLILTRVGSDQFCAHYYNPAGRVISLGVLSFR